MSNELLNELLAEAKKTTVDQTKEPERKAFEIPAAGPTPARFIGYVEVGKQPQEFNGKAKAPAIVAYMTFELNGPKHRIKFEKDGVETEVTNIIRINEAVYTNSKANFFKLFNAMRQERESITHMAQMLGEGFLVHVVHNSVGEGADKKTYANLHDANGWRIGPPIYQDPLDPDNVRQIPVPPATRPYQLLLWDTPSKKQWDSIFIDGEREVKGKDGTVTKQSKNYLQELCLKSVDFESSALADLLTGTDAMMKEMQQEEPKKDPPTKEPKKEVVKEEQKQETVKEEPAAPSEKQSKDAADILASLGIG